MNEAKTQGKVYPSIVTIQLELPIALSRVHAGFPSPAEDYVEGALDIGQYLVKRPKTTFFMRVVGDSMEGLGIRENDLLVIDRAEPIVDRCIVVARIGDEFCVKQFKKEKGSAGLYSTNPKYKPIPIGEESDIEIWGRVMHKVSSFTGKVS